MAERACRAIADGCDLAVAAERGAITLETLRRWLDEDGDFRARCRAAAEIGCPPLAKRLAREDAVRAVAAAEEARRAVARRVQAEHAAREARLEALRARDRAAKLERQEYFRRIELGLAPSDESQAKETASGAGDMKPPAGADGNTASPPPSTPPQPPEKEKKHPYLVPAGWSIVLPDEPPVHLTMADYDPFSW